MITLDDYAASHRAVRELKAAGSLPGQTKLRSSKYLNNLIEQNHQSVKQRIAAMRRFKRFRDAAIAIAGIELMTASEKSSLGHDVSEFTAELRPQSGTWCSGA